MSSSLLSISMRICSLNPRLEAVPLGDDLRSVGRVFYNLLAEKRKYLAPDDFTCGKTKDCTLCLVEIECRSLPWKILFADTYRCCIAYFVKV